MCRDSSVSNRLTDKEGESPLPEHTSKLRNILLGLGSWCFLDTTASYIFELVEQQKPLDLYKAWMCSKSYAHYTAKIIEVQNVRTV